MAHSSFIPDTAVVAVSLSQRSLWTKGVGTITKLPAKQVWQLSVEGRSSSILDYPFSSDWAVGDAWLQLSYNLVNMFICLLKQISLISWRILIKMLELPYQIPVELDFSSPLPLSLFPSILGSVSAYGLIWTQWLKLLKTCSFFSAMSSVISFLYLPEFTIPYLNIGCSPHVLDHSL